MPSHNTTLQEIKDRIDIVDLVSEYVNLKKAGQNWKGLCPFHTEKTPSFTVSPAKQIFHCFGCDTGGDIFTFIMRSENLTFPEALKMLAGRAGVELKSSFPASAKAGEKETLLAIQKEAAVFFRKNLEKNPRAVDYLKARGITGETLESFSLGYAPMSWNALLTHLSRKGYKPDIVKKAGLAAQGRKGHYDIFRDRIIFPIHDLKGDVTAFGGRSIDGSEPKYLNSPETLIFNKSRVLYGLNRAKDFVKKEGRALFMEGYLDVITAHAYGFSNAVAPLGTAFTHGHGKLIHRFTEEVIVVFDSDEAGAKAAGKAASILLESGLNVKILAIPENDDPDGFLRKHGKDAFCRLLESPLNVIDFFMNQKGDRRATANKLLDIISKVPDRILLGEYVRTLSEKLNVKESFVLEQLEMVKRRAAGGHHRQDASGTFRKTVPKPLDEVYMIRLLLQMSEKTEEICGSLSDDDFRHPVTRGIFRKIKNGSAVFNELLSECEGEERDLLTKISLEEGFEEPERVLNDCIKRMKENKRKAQLRDIQNKIRDAESRGDLERMKQYQVELQKLLKK